MNDDLHDSPDPSDALPSSRETAAWTLGGAALGTAAALFVLPRIAPALSAALWDPQPKAWWILSRASGLVAYGMLTVSMLLGLLLSTKLAKEWPGGAAALALHEHASVLGLALTVVHGLVLLGDRHTPFTLAEIALPFGAAHRPVAIGAGQLAFYGMLVLTVSVYVRKHIGPHGWRLLHFASFAVFCLALMHGLAAATDRTAMIGGALLGAAVLFLSVYRVLVRVFGAAPRAAPRMRNREATAPAPM